MNEIINVIRELDYDGLKQIDVILPYGKLDEFIGILRSSNLVSLNRLGRKKYEYDLLTDNEIMIKISPMDINRFRGRNFFNGKIIIFNSIKTGKLFNEKFLNSIIPQIAINKNWEEMIIHIYE